MGRVPVTALRLSCDCLAAALRLSEDQPVVVPVALVVGDYDFFPWLQPFLDFIILRVLAAYPDFPFDRSGAVGSEHIYPFAARVLVECPAWNQYGFFRLPELRFM